MKILSIADKEGSAIDRLCKMNQKRLSHLQYKHINVHPKRPSPQTLAEVEKLIRWADVIDCAYWKSAVLLRKMFPAMNGKRLILTHNNEHNIHDDGKNHWEWQDMPWDLIVAKNKWQQDELKKSGVPSTLVRHAVEFDNFSFAPKLPEGKIVGYVGQIKKVKGVREIQKACAELGYKLMIIGKPSEAEYWVEMDKENLTLYSDVPDDKIGELYRQMRVFVCNSDDGTESGTLPILEAMVSGVPVISRKIGHVRESGEHMKNMFILDKHYQDIEQLKAAISFIVENDDISEELRENAWRTVRPYNADVHAREYEKLYYKVMYANKPTVSVVMPTFNRAHLLTAQFEALSQQTYQNFEIVIVNDGSTDETDIVVEEARKLYDIPIRLVQTGDFPINGVKKYGLAKARNMGIIESIGEITVLCDDRLKMHENAIENFVTRLEEHGDKKYWAWGSKGVFKQFVENFSATWRRTLIDGGMFCERIEQYGGLTQETNQRFTRQGVMFDWAPECLCEPLMGTHSKSKNRENIIKSKMTLYKMGMQ